MALEKLTEAVGEFLHRKKKGRKLQAKKIRKVLDKLEEKKKKYDKDYAKERSEKAKKRLALRLKIVKAQIAKARKLLKDRVE